MDRRIVLTAAHLRAYSRAGNFHSDPEAAAALGLTHLVAAGMQVAGPALGALLDAWGADFLERGEVALKFVAPVHDGTEVEARVDIDAAAATATIEVVAGPTGPAARTAVVGSARLVPFAP